MTDGSIAVAGFPDLQTDVTDLVVPPEVSSTNLDALWSDVATALITECCTPIATEFYFLAAARLQGSDDFLQSLNVKMDVLRFQASVSNPGSNTDFADVLEKIDHSTGPVQCQIDPLKRHVNPSLPAGTV